MSSLRRRGQVWVIFDSIEDASAAMNKLQGELAFGKRMRISFSRNISDKTRQRKGMEPRQKRTTPLVAAEPITKKPEGSSFFETSVAAPKTSSQSYNPPNRILFIENLSETCSADSLAPIFSQFEGFIEVRLIPSRGVGFAEFQDEYKSQAALAKLQGKELEKGRFLMISNAKK
jgi:RNA recognition motif-containing protein